MHRLRTTILESGSIIVQTAEFVQSVHSACAPLILQSEQGVNSLYSEDVYKFINIKFGHVEKRPFSPTSYYYTENIWLE
ncbi:hypothetical protein Hanom_Chr04g00311531 [Helianthus anomalus]